jgi:hypothetical protein
VIFRCSPGAIFDAGNDDMRAHLAVALMLALATAGPAAAQTGRRHATDAVVATNGAFHPLASVRIEAS